MDEPSRDIGAADPVLFACDRWPGGLRLTPGAFRPVRHTHKKPRTRRGRWGRGQAVSRFGLARLLVGQQFQGGADAGGML